MFSHVILFRRQDAVTAFAIQTGHEMILKGRGVIYAQDIMVFTGRSRSYAYNIMKQVRRQYGKSKHQMVTVEEYAEFHGIPIDDLKTTLFG